LGRPQWLQELEVSLILSVVAGAAVVGAGAAAGVASPAAFPSFATAQWLLEHGMWLERK